MEMDKETKIHSKLLDLDIFQTNSNNIRKVLFEKSTFWIGFDSHDGYNIFKYEVRLGNIDTDNINEFLQYYYVKNGFYTVVLGPEKDKTILNGPSIILLNDNR